MLKNGKYPDELREVAGSMRLGRKTADNNGEAPPECVAVLGLGYVGIPLALRAVQVGYRVVGFDVDDHKVSNLSLGRSHVGDVANDELAAALETGRFLPTTHSRDLVGFDVAVITVPTPLTDGSPDLYSIESAAWMIAEFVRPECTVILESTSYPGTTEEVLGPILEAGSGLRAGRDFHLGFSPERIDPGNRAWTFTNTPKIVSGVDEVSTKAVQAFYDNLVDRTVPVSGTREAELCKLLENTFRYVNIALVNELAVHAHGLGINIWEVLSAASTKPFGFMPFFPGPGVGGHCLPVDPSYLSWKIERDLGVTSRFIQASNEVNAMMPAYVVERVCSGLAKRGLPIEGAKILVLGLAYKKNSEDVRGTPAVPVVTGLLACGAAVRVHDPHVGTHPIDRLAPRVDLAAEELLAADAVVLVTDHDDVDYELVSLHSSYVFDARNRLSGERVEAL